MRKPDASKRYEGRPCKKCGGTTRYIATGACCVCRAAYYKRRDPNPARGAKFEGEECPHCGGAVRYVKNGLCVPCTIRRAKDSLARRGGQRLARLYMLKREYGLTHEQYAAILARQNHRCAICTTDSPGGQHDTWHVDHDHVTGKVRGLLCNRCNWGLGKFEDDPARMRRAALYVETQGEDPYLVTDAGFLMGMVG